MVKGFSKVFLIGNLTRDPETRSIPTGTNVTNFSVAVNNSWRGKDGVSHEETGFFDCVAWSGLGDTIAKFLKKGDPIFIGGRLSQRSWEDEKTKTKRYRTEVVVEDFNFIGGGNGGGPKNDFGGNNSEASFVSSYTAPASNNKPSAPKASEINLDDIDENTEIDLSEVPF
ncbi:MAG: single-stranded DNA-binding protein [Candidatus Nomurabacteria bacterium]|jgi:single-strand DNA-binding protein|nr:single-stranded DNA-binding protein [Candidatus Nomurabacteria bacterium]